MNQQLVDDLRATRQTLQERGRCKVSLTKTDGTVCLDGAVGVALIPGFEVMDRQFCAARDATHSDPYHVLQRSPRALAVVKALAKEVGHWMIFGDFDAVTVAHEADGDPVKACWMFNDRTSATDADCFDAIDKALADLGGL